MNDNLFAFEIKPYGHHASNDTCMLYNQPSSQTSESGKNKSKHTMDIIMVGLFLIGVTLALTHSADILIEPKHQANEATQEQDTLGVTHKHESLKTKKLPERIK